MKRLLVAITTVVLAGGAVIAMATTASGTTKRVAADRDREGASSIQVETQRTSLHFNGNTVTLTEDLFVDGKKVGTSQIACFLTGPGPLALCQAAAMLPLGEITSQGSVAIPPAVGSSFTVAITGGTGAYSHARGTVVTTQTTGTTSSDTYRVSGASDG